MCAYIDIYIYIDAFPKVRREERTDLYLFLLSLRR